MRIYHIMMLVMALTLAHAEDNSENVIRLHNGQLEIHSDSAWAIISHTPGSGRSAVAFQLLGNQAEVGTPHSSNLVVTAIDVTVTELLIPFTQVLISKPKEGEVDSEYKGWAVRRWSGKQDEVDYSIIDARTTNTATSLGVHIRIAWPMLADNPEGYDDRMLEIVHVMIQQINRDNSDSAQQDDSEGTP